MNKFVQIRFSQLLELAVKSLTETNTTTAFFMDIMNILTNGTIGAAMRNRRRMVVFSSASSRAKGLFVLLVLKI